MTYQNTLLKIHTGSSLAIMAGVVSYICATDTSLGGEGPFYLDTQGIVLLTLCGALFSAVTTSFLLYHNYNYPDPIINATNDAKNDDEKKVAVNIAPSDSAYKSIFLIGAAGIVCMLVAAIYATVAVSGITDANPFDPPAASHGPRSSHEISIFSGIYASFVIHALSLIYLSWNNFSPASTSAPLRPSSPKVPSQDQKPAQGNDQNNDQGNNQGNEDKASNLPSPLI